MSPLILKEIRLLLPGWAVSLLLALCTGLIPENQQFYSIFLISFIMFLFLLCSAMLLITALSSFGGEFSSGTFSLLLAQPVSRSRIWWTKTLLLAAAVLSIWLTWCLSYSVQEPMRTAGWYSARQVWLPTALFVLAVYSGGLWTVLLFRQVAAAFWFTVLTPAALLMTVLNLLDNHPAIVVNRVLTIVFVVYGLAGFLLARWLFLRAQDAHWMGGALVMPGMRGRTWFKIGSGECRIWRPRTALLRKELQLHQSQFLMAGVLVLLHLGVIATRKFGHFPKNSTEEFLLESFWLLWLVVMPLLTGCAAVAEERKMGTLENQLCLPAKRRTQFAVKLFVTLALAVLLGTIIPWLLEGRRILPDLHFNADHILADINHSGFFATTATGMVWLTLLSILALLSPLLPLFLLALISAGIAALAFYTSTMARNTLQTLGPAILSIVMTWSLMVAFHPAVIGYPLWRSGLIYLIGVPVMVMVLAALAFWNFKRVLVGWTVWRRNLLTLVLSLALVMMATTALYHRAWELLTPLEPPHGAARLANSTSLRVNHGGNIAVFLPNGGVWLTRYLHFAPNPFQIQIIQSPMFGGGRFLEGTNWTDIADH